MLDYGLKFSYLNAPIVFSFSDLAVFSSSKFILFGYCVLAVVEGY